MPEPPEIRLEQVRYRYRPDRRWALDGVSLTMEPGAALAVAGANGSGKTTLVHLIAGLLQPEQGVVTLDGRPTGEFPAGLVARSVGLVFQNPDDQIFCSTVEAEVAYGPERIGLERTQVQVQVTRALDRFELSALRDVPPAALPFHYRRRVSLAAVWAMDTPVLIVDEPSWGLDMRETGRLTDTLNSARAQGKTIVVVSHDTRLLLETCSRMVIMDRGRVAADGSPQDLWAAPERAAARGVSVPAALELAARLGLAGQMAGIPTVEALCAAITGRLGQGRSS